MEITIVYDNLPNSSVPALRAGWGFSAYIEIEGKKILFDMGWHYSRFENNCKELGINLGKLDGIFISHNHWDHMGSLPMMLEKVATPDIYVPEDFSNRIIGEIQFLAPGSTVERCKDFKVLSRISPNLASTGTHKEGNGANEQALLIKNSDSELILIVGCTHPGLNPFFNAATNFGSITRIIGGLHGFKDIDFIQRSNVKALYIGHCTEHSNLFTTLSNIHVELINVGSHITI